MSQREIKISKTAPELFRDAAEEYVRVAVNAVKERHRFTVALAGGSTPRSLYSLLATDYRSSVPWQQTLFFWGDERHVPPDNPESNYRMVHEAMLSKVPIRPENVFRVQAEDPDANRAALAYEQVLARSFNLKPGEFPRFDLILLGMGPDGHTASLFPGSTGLNETKRLVIANWIEKFKTERITFTFPVLNHARCVVFLASGPDKAAMAKNVLEGAISPPYPSQLVDPTDGQLLWMLDEGAAADLNRK